MIDYILTFLRAGFPFALEFMVFGMAMESAVAVRKADDAEVKVSLVYALLLHLCCCTLFCCTLP